MRFNYTHNSSFHLVDSAEGHWNSGKEEFPNLGYKIRAKEGYFPVAPADTQQDIRNEMCLELEKAGIPIERQHHEVATAGQAEIDIRFAPMKQMGDWMQYYKYIVRNVAKKHGKTVTFMPKPLFGDNGSGMHTHMSLWKEGKPLFAGNGYAGLSEMALFFIGGILKHAPALTCITNPTTNSYKRLVPGLRSAGEPGLFRAQPLRRDPHPDLLGESESQTHRVPHAGLRRRILTSPSPRCSWPGLDGIQNRIDPGDPLDKNLYELPPEELAQVPSVPDSLSGAIKALRSRSLLPAQRRRLQRRLHQELDRDEAKGIRRASAAPAPLRIRDVFRRLARRFWPAFDGAMWSHSHQLIGAGDPLGSDRFALFACVASRHATLRPPPTPRQVWRVSSR